MTTNGVRRAPPRASSMVESLRGLGYSTATALADLIDNSIAAGANRVSLQFNWLDSQSTILVLDNGRGMNDAELERAMRLGSRSPLDARDPSDLGRFGLGLKTASFSQCRQLTVASRKDGQISCLRWDLDVLESAAEDGWLLLEGPAEGSDAFLDPLGEVSSGTLVLWQALDRVVTSGFQQQNFLDLIDEVEAHLAMVFHRYIDGPRADLEITINGRAVHPWDPFLLRHSATWSSPIERLRCGPTTVEVQCYVLPHRDRLSEREQLISGGPHGWTAQQGFYVYRNRRLLVAGSWLGLGRGRAWTKEEAHRLARIRVDIPNTADSEWKLDVRKSNARPPVEVRDRITLLAEDARLRARRVFAHRGAPNASAVGQPILHAWRTEHFQGGVRYRIDTSHAAVRAVLDAAEGSASEIHAMLRVIEETVPVQRIWLDTTEMRETPRTGFAGAPRESVQRVLDVLYRNMILRKGMPCDEAKRCLRSMEPFDQYPELVDSLSEINDQFSQGSE